MAPHQKEDIWREWLQLDVNKEADKPMLVFAELVCLFPGLSIEFIFFRLHPYIYICMYCVLALTVSFKLLTCVISCCFSFQQGSKSTLPRHWTYDESKKLFVNGKNQKVLKHHPRVSRFQEKVANRRQMIKFNLSYADDETATLTESSEVDESGEEDMSYDQQNTNDSDDDQHLRGISDTGHLKPSQSNVSKASGLSALSGLSQLSQSTRQSEKYRNPLDATRATTAPPASVSTATSRSTGARAESRPNTSTGYDGLSPTARSKSRETHSRRESPRVGTSQSQLSPQPRSGRSNHETEHVQNRSEPSHSGKVGTRQQSYHSSEELQANNRRISQLEREVEELNSFHKQQKKQWEEEIDRVSKLRTTDVDRLTAQLEELRASHRRSMEEQRTQYESQLSSLR